MEGASTSVYVSVAFFISGLVSANALDLQAQGSVGLYLKRFSMENFIAENGYPIEVHVNVETEDGYLLDLHRIPHGKLNNSMANKPAVFLMHGLMASAENWVVTGPNEALAFQLADEGFDVWMGNARGTTHSRKHTVLDPNTDNEYWQFSWHEIGMYDLPAMIDYILEETKQEKLFYIGHSQGTTTFFVMASERPEYNNNISLMVALAPIVYCSHMPNPALRLFSMFGGSTNFLLANIGVHEFTPNKELMNLAGQAICQETAIIREVCANIFFLVAGYDSQQLDRSVLPNILSSLPDTISTAQLIHYGQIIRSGAFQKYDYGVFGNMARYGSPVPPTYDISKVKSPVALFYASNDWLAAEEDVERLYRELPNPVMKYLIPYKPFTHVDFLLAKDARALVYNEMILLMRKFVN